MLIRKVRDTKLISKLNKVSAFECLDFEEHIKKYNSKETLFYLDPPYFGTEFQYYRGAEHFGREGHQRLSDVLKIHAINASIKIIIFEYLEEEDGKFVKFLKKYFSVMIYLFL